MKITDRDILEALRGAKEEEKDLSGVLEKIASAEEVLEEHDTSLGELEDEEVLEVLAEAGMEEDEIAAALELLEEAEAEEAEGSEESEEGEEGDEESELLEKEAAAEDMYLRGYAYGLGFNDAMSEGMEKTAAKKAGKSPTALEALKERIGAHKAAGRKLAFEKGSLKRGERFAKGEKTRAALKGMFSKGGAKAMKKAEYKDLPLLARMVRRASMKGKGLSGKLSKGKLGGIGAGLLAVTGAGAYAAARKKKG
jgi:hypothetical protein